MAGAQVIHVLHGANSLGIQERARLLRDQGDPTGINTTIIDQAAGHLGDLRSACCAIGFFGTSRVVIARDLITPKGTRRKRRTAKSADGSPLDQVIGVMNDVPPTTLLIVIEESVGPVEERALKTVTQEVRVERLDVPRGRELVTWAMNRARLYDTEFEPGSAERLLEALFPGSWSARPRGDDVPPDLYRLDTEIAKLAVAAGAGGKITAGQIAELVPGAEALNIWGLTNAIAGGNPASAVQEIERELASGTPAEMIIGQLVGLFETFAALLIQGGPPDIRAVAAETGLSEARLQQAARSIRHFSPERVRWALAALRDIDFAAKQGQVDAQDALAGIVVQLATRS
ncbi:DNA polymerase III, delta subunit [Nitrolancea hollandica Lb]|uniref:DNA-directed DNA polymerase n=1 Tax=Nitrolancea hollandica Lb TaxID=1129897 RepID=I4EDR0_9BACT|nr:DNA polymerase III, delta subunit [Nitrolancea hollandica Lb]